MKKATITISYDEEKLNALKLYLGQKEMQPEDELAKALDALYSKVVPANVREYIEMSAGGNSASMQKPPRRPKSYSPSVVGECRKPEMI